MNKKNLSIYIISVGLILASITSLAETEVIRFATAVYPPFTMAKNNNQELQGFDIDIAKALCEKINAKCTFNNDQFSNIASSLNTKKYDAWISAISISKDRQKEVTFTKPYFSATALLIATKTTVFNGAPVEIKGKTIGAEEHSCYIPYLKNTYGDNIKIKMFTTKKEAHDALRNDQVDAIIDDAIVLKHWRMVQKDKARYRLIGLPAKYPDLVWHRYGIAVAKDNVELAKKLNQAISHIKSNGTYDKLLEKHFAN